MMIDTLRQQQPYSFTSLERLEKARQFAPQCIRIVAALIQESVAEFVSPLLMIGLIMSMSNFLLHGVIFSAWAGIPVIWAIIQCVAIDANLGVMIVRCVRNFQSQEWMKGAIYLLISFVLLFVAAIIFDVEAVQSVLNHSIGLPIPIEWLTMLRSAAIVALVATVQLESVSIKFERKASKQAVNAGGKQAEDSGMDEVEKRDTGKLEAITGEQLQRLEDAYQRLSQGGQHFMFSARQLREAAGVRAEIVGPWLETRLKQEGLSRANGSTPVPA